MMLRTKLIYYNIMQNPYQPKQNASDYQYDCGADGTQTVKRAAEVIVPILMEYFHPKSVIDFGCGLGDWLLQFSHAGVDIISGLDGDWIPLNNLQIPPLSFTKVDFTSDYKVDGKFELAICFEVAEHFTDKCSNHLLDTLIQASDIVAFSAAIPNQGGYEHINERFQQEWIERFSARGYTAFDLIRPRVWLNQDVSFWYQQNMLIFCRNNSVQHYGLQEHPILTSIIHPELYLRRCDPKTWSLREIVKHIPYYITRNMRTKWQRK